MVTKSIRSDSSPKKYTSTLFSALGFVSLILTIGISADNFRSKLDNIVTKPELKLVQQDVSDKFRELGATIGKLEDRTAVLEKNLAVLEERLKTLEKSKR